MTDNGILAVLPENITDVASSFYEGLFADLSERYWQEHAHKLVVISRLQIKLNGV